MVLSERKIKMLKNRMSYFDKLLNITNKIEYNFNRFNINIEQFNLISIHSINESTFNYKMYEQYYNIVQNKENINENFSNVYKFIENNIDLLENVIKVYGKFIKYDILLNIQIKDLNLNTNVNNKFEFFKNYDLYKFYKDFY